MRYNIVAGEELKKIMSKGLDNPVPFNEDMSKGSFSREPFSEEFMKERSLVHGVSLSLYKEKLSAFLSVLKNITREDEVHLYFGEDETCLANRTFLIKYFAGLAKEIRLHVVNEYTGEQITEFAY